MFNIATNSIMGKSLQIVSIKIFKKGEKLKRIVSKMSLSLFAIYLLLSYAKS